MPYPHSSLDTAAHLYIAKSYEHPCKQKNYKTKQKLLSEKAPWPGGTRSTAALVTLLVPLLCQHSTGQMKQRPNTKKPDLWSTTGSREAEQMSLLTIIPESSSHLYV